MSFRIRAFLLVLVSIVLSACVDTGTNKSASVSTPAPQNVRAIGYVQNACPQEATTVLWAVNGGHHKLCGPVTVFDYAYSGSIRDNIHGYFYRVDYDVYYTADDIKVYVPKSYFYRRAGGKDRRSRRGKGRWSEQGGVVTYSAHISIRFGDD